jgi:hypothetical protein
LCEAKTGSGSCASIDNADVRNECESYKR